ncbi:48f54627-baf2-43c3-a939-b18945d188e2 [Thermothielavioides terrestris]|uniref:Uncharacterized protein n=2 Tax=Thermothielavioides terrestris TaxID=2587410 RepID=G2R0E7_THETT|nr:uncharacterized protein THITE_152897 [Thermothielavioides terrestris NRRL 8126]AEO65612.1 hypothetical protein THITE_152897 [Thermothielavioides terrestris NRRL 8126]SPQ19132.1 48f54627-baf2-43c3-a939-b18945d188e2 [Thermothielavioides terrestris]
MELGILQSHTPCPLDTRPSPNYPGERHGKVCPVSAPNDAAASSTGAEANENVMFGGKAKKSFVFFAIIASLSLTGLLSAIEGIITRSALPTITNDLGGGNL